MAHDAEQVGSGTRAAVDSGVGEGEQLCVRGYRIPDVCKLTGLGRTSIYEAIKSGDLVAHKWNNCTIVLSHDLAAFLTNLPRREDAAPINIIAALTALVRQCQSGFTKSQLDELLAAELGFNSTDLIELVALLGQFAAAWQEHANNTTIEEPGRHRRYEL